MLAALRQAFNAQYGVLPEQIIKAPGRVNLIGEHTDYNNGFVLPCALDCYTLAAISARADDEICVLALDCNAESDQFSLNQTITLRTGQPWANYVRGVVVALRKRGYRLRGANIAVTGNIPQGAGLSSSAALEIAVAKAITAIAGLELSNLQLALVGQEAENDFVGCNCGIMDQLICTSAIAGHALAIDCRDNSIQPVAIPDQWSLVVINSNVRRGLLDSEYNRRREQCEAAAKHFGAGSLREVTLAQFHAGKGGLDSVTAGRALHVLTENARTLAAVEALRAADMRQLSRLMAQSHCSMKELFEITVPAIDFLVDTLSDLLGDAGGVRMTGGGFGGCVVAIVPHERVDAVVAAVEQVYFAKTGLKESIYRSLPTQGVMRVG